MRRFRESRSHHFPNRSVDALLVLHVERWWNSPELFQNLLRVLRSAKLPVIAVAIAAKENHIAAHFAERAPHRLRSLQQPDYAQHRRRENSFPQGLVVKADVSTRDRRLEETAGFRHPLNRFHQLRHNL